MKVKVEVNILQYVYIQSVLWLFTMVFLYMDSVDATNEWNKRATSHKHLDVSNTSTSQVNSTYDFNNIGQNLEKNLSTSNDNAAVVDESRDFTTIAPSRNNELPIPIMIASPAVAVAIVIFICLAYRWHTHQLDAQAKELALQLAVNCPSPCMPCSPCHTTQRLLPPNPTMNTSSPSHSDTDLLGARRKSLRSASPTLLAPPGLGNKRGSSWSALSDQEIVSHSPRRHSTFLL